MDKTLIEKFFSGLATRDERKRFMEWIHSEASEMEVAQEVKQYFEGTADKTFLWDDKKTLKKLQLKIMALQARDTKDQRINDKSIPPFYTQKHHHLKSPVKRFKITRILKIAAILFIVPTISILIWRNHVQQQSEPQKTAMLSKSTGQGQKLSFYLDDGSKVMLNASSMITFPNKFTGDERKVVLEGEAYFEVVKDASKPFMVISGNYMTRVLGTSFVVDARKK